MGSPLPSPPVLPHQPSNSLAPNRGRGRKPLLRAVGLGLITGAADDDCSAIGTYASIGARFGYQMLWTAPVTFPMMACAVYLAAKLGQVTGEGLFGVIRRHHSKWFLYSVLTGVLIGNTIEAGADLGGMAAALTMFVPLSERTIVVLVTAVILILQIWGSYSTIRNIFRVLALSLLAYVFSAFLAHPHLGSVIQGTFIPRVHFDRTFLSLLVACIGTSLSAYLFTWQSNEEVEEKIEAGRRRLAERRGASRAELESSLWDVIFGMLFSNVVMYFIMLATAATLFAAGKTNISTAAEAAQALQPLAGKAAGLLFTLGIVGVGFLAVPVMTCGAAYDLCQSVGWKHGLYRKPGEAPKFYIVITVFTLLALALNFIGVNPMKALVWAGIVQGFSTPPLMLLIIWMTNRRSIMGDKVNRPLTNVFAMVTLVTIFAASAGLILSWVWHG